MTALLQRLNRHACHSPSVPAIRDQDLQLDYAQLVEEIDRLTALLAARFRSKRVGLMLDNGIPWACLDLAILQSGAVCVPIPLFFTTSQIQHLIEDADLDLVITDQAERTAALLPNSIVMGIDAGGQRLAAFRRHSQTVPRTLPAGTVKITYTSGTTGQPKGVCLSGDTLQIVTGSLCGAVGASPIDRALSVLPLSTLLENIAGLYAPLWSGASAQVPSLASIGLTGSTGPDLKRLFSLIERAQPTSLVVVPQLLKALVGGLHTGLPCPRSLRFVAVGGAVVSEQLLLQAERLGLPVYQGFGLSEAGSVVSLNRPEANRPGSVGKPLPHLNVTIADDGEILVRGPLFLGYLDAEPGQKPGNKPATWPTGDLGHLDEDGYLFLHGRKKTAYATAYGRNVSPEWVEATLTDQPAIAQAAVFGADRHINVALVIPAAHLGDDDIEQAIDDAITQANALLPDYARVGRWAVPDEPFHLGNGLAAPDGSVRRQAIQSTFNQLIHELYATEEVSNGLL